MCEKIGEKRDMLKKMCKKRQTHTPNDVKIVYGINVYLSKLVLLKTRRIA